MSMENIFSNLEFSKDEMVKKMLVNKENYKVIRISLETGVEIPPHAGSHSVFFLVLKGRGIFTNGDDKSELKANQFISIGSDKIRGIKCIEQMVILAVRD